MSFFGIPSGRRKALSTVRLLTANGNTTSNANLYLDSGTASTVTYYPGSWTVLFASTAQTVNYIEIFDAFGATARFATGSSGSEADLFLDYPGGNGFVPVLIPAGSRLTIQPTANPIYVAGSTPQELVINFYT